VAGDVGRETVSVAGGRLHVWHSRAGNSELIACRGWLDSETSDHVQALVDAAVDDRVERLQFDLSTLIGLDESGRRCLRKTSERCEADEIVLEIDANRPMLEAIRRSLSWQRPSEL
jgi:hypothetical protein